MTHDAYFGHDAEIEAFLSPWGPQEFQKYKEEIENVKIQDNGSYLSGEKNIKKASFRNFWSLTSQYSLKKLFFSRRINPHAPDRLTPHGPVAQKIADQRWLIAISAKNRHLFK